MDFTSPALATVNALDHDKTYNYARVQEIAASTAADNMTAHGRYRRAREDSRPVNLLSEQAQADFQKFFQEMKRKYPLEYSLREGKPPTDIIGVLANHAFRERKIPPRDKKESRHRGRGKGSRGRGRVKPSRNFGKE